jgi:hypothetical protein
MAAPPPLVKISWLNYPREKYTGRENKVNQGPEK